MNYENDGNVNLMIKNKQLVTVLHSVGMRLLQNPIIIVIVYLFLITK